MGFRSRDKTRRPAHTGGKPIFVETSKSPHGFQIHMNQVQGEDLCVWNDGTNWKKTSTGNHQKAKIIYKHWKTLKSIERHFTQLLLLYVSLTHTIVRLRLCGLLIILLLCVYDPFSYFTLIFDTFHCFSMIIIFFNLCNHSVHIFLLTQSRDEIPEPCSYLKRESRPENIAWCRDTLYTAFESTIKEPTSTVSWFMRCDGEHGKI